MAPVILILGSGPRIGAALTASFSQNGYKIALVSRNGSNSLNAQGFLSLKADLYDHSSIPSLFTAVKAEFGSFPSTVVYNAGGLTMPSEKDNMFSVSAESVAKDLGINTLSAYVAAQQAVLGWKELGEGVKKTFIYTGNATNVTVVPMPMFLSIGIGKSASASWIGLADTLYKGQGFRFFYADERHEDGKLKGHALDGGAHGDFYLQLAKQEENVPWQATFVKGKGYVQFKN